MERIDDLGIGGLKIIQDTDYFCFGTDAVLLANFATVKQDTKVVDLCSGNGIIPLLLSEKTKAREIIGVEIVKKSFFLAQKSAELNNLSHKVKFINCDANNCVDFLEAGTFSTVTCNPPYMTGDWGFKSAADEKAMARHEITITLDDVLKISSKLLKFGGYFSMVHRCERLCDILCTMRKYNIEPKRLRFVHSKAQDAPKLLLIEGILGAKPSLITMKPLYIYNDDNSYTKEVKRMYNKEC